MKDIWGCSEARTYLPVPGGCLTPRVRLVVRGYCGGVSVFLSQHPVPPNQSVGSLSWFTHMGGSAFFFFLFLPTSEHVWFSNAGDHVIF